MYKRIIEIIRELDKKTIPVFVEARKSIISDKEEDNRNLGVNKIGYAKVGRTDSSTNEFIENRKITLQTGLDDIRKETLGNVDDAYALLMSKIQCEDDINFSKLCILIYDTVTEYFGYGFDAGKRLEIFMEQDYESKNEISSIKGMNIAMCTERATLSHNLLKFMGIDGTLKFSEVMNDGEKDIHAYNLIHNDGKYYIFDSSIPKIEGEVITPLITRISDEGYALISSKDANVGATIDVTYETPRREGIHKFSYDYGRDYREEYDYVTPKMR